MPKSEARNRPRSVAEAVRDGDGRYPFGDSIYLIVRGGSALWEYQFREATRLRTMGLGSAVARVPGDQPVTITEARAKRHAAWIARRNGEALPAAGQAGKRFAQAAKDYLEAHRNEWSPKQHKDHDRRLRMHAAALNSKPVNRITVDDMVAVLKPIWTGPNHGRGSKLRGIVELILNAEEVHQPTPAAWSRLKGKLSTKNQEVISRPAITSTDLPGLMADLAKDDSTITRAIRFATLTVTRQMEPLAAKWSEFDFKNMVWIVPKDRRGRKTGVEHAVPLTPEMIACLPPREADCEFVFPSVRGGHLSHASTGPVLAEYKRKDHKGRPITLHGMRATFQQWAEGQRFAKLTIDRCTAHSLNKVDRAYYRGTELTPDYLASDAFKLRRELMESWSKFATTK